MKLKNRKKAIVLCAAFVAAGVGMNVQNAIAGYGMDQDVVSLVASGSSNSGSNGSSNSSSYGEFDYFLDKDDCTISFGTEADAILFVKKYGFKCSVRYGKVLDLTDETEVYSKKQDWKFWRSAVRCQKDILCYDVMQKYNLKDLL